MFAKNKVSQSMLDAVNSVLTEKLDEASLKITTPTGTKVLGGSGYGSKKAHEVQHKNPFEKGPSKSQLKGIKAPTKKELKSIGEEEVQEELKGNQSKIDANHNGKIDGQDFAILRGKKKVKTEGMEFANKLISSIAERDEGKPGLMFKKIASKAAKEYDSKEAGNRVAGFIRKKVLAKEDISEEQLDEMINEVLSKDASAGDYIHDFVHSKNPKFAGKSTAERKKMALGAYYGAQKEEVDDYEMNKNKSEAEDTAARKSIKAKDTEKNQKIDNLDVKYGTPNSFKCEEVELDEAAPKKMNDVMRGKQNLEPAKKGVIGTVKSDLKNFKNFLTGKKETNEAINPSNQTIDTLAGRSKKVPKDAKMDNAHSSVKVELKAEEVESLGEDRYLEKFLSSRGINPKFVDRNTKVAHAKSNEYKSWLKNHKDIIRNESKEVDVPFDKPYKTTKEPINTDKLMNRARVLATKALKKVKNETMMGTAGATSESKKKW